MQPKNSAEEGGATEVKGGAAEAKGVGGGALERAENIKFTN